MRGWWHFFYLAGLGERRSFYRFSSRCPDLTQRGNRNGSPFTLPPPCGGEKLVRGRWRLFYLAGLGERRPFYGFSGRCPDLTQRGNRNGSPFTLPPPCGGEKPVRGWWRLFYLVGLGERRLFYRFSGRCPDLTQRGNRKGSPFTLPPPCGGEKLVRRWWRLFAAIMRASRGGRLFLYREYYLRGDIRRVGARAVRGSWCRGRARRAGRRRRPHAAEGRGARPGRGGLPCGP